MLQVRQCILLADAGQVRQAGRSQCEGKDLFVLHETDMPQRMQRPGIKIGDVPRPVGAARAEQPPPSAVQPR